MDPSPRPLGGEGGEPVRLSAANGPEQSEGAQGKLREPGEGRLETMTVKNFAGAKSVVASLWTGNDTYTTTLTCSIRAATKD